MGGAQSTTASRFKSVSVLVRLVPFCCVMAAGVVVAQLGYRSFVTNLSNFLDVLLVLFIPWSAVNLADYFVVRRARCDVGAFFVPGSTYGSVAWRGLLAYAIGLAAEWPFVSQPDYTGPLVKALGGADISWLIGWFVSAAVYLLVMRGATSTDRARGRAAARGVRDRAGLTARRDHRGLVGGSLMETAMTGTGPAGGRVLAVRSGVVPALAKGFTGRPETASGLAGALVPGTVAALVSSDPQELAGSCGKTQLPVHALSRCGAWAGWSCWPGWMPAAVPRCWPGTCRPQQRSASRRPALPSRWPAGSPAGLPPLPGRGCWSSMTCATEPTWRACGLTGRWARS